MSDIVVNKVTNGFIVSRRDYARNYPCKSEDIIIVEHKPGLDEEMKAIGAAVVKLFLEPTKEKPEYES